MRFVKENSYDILKLFINQIGIAIFSLFLYTAVGMIEDDALKFTINIFVSLFAIVFYLFLLYTVAWEWGAKDKIRYDAGRFTLKMGKGALIAFYANIINFLIAFIAVISMLFVINNENSWFGSLFDVSNLIMRFISSMNIGFLSGLFSKLEYRSLFESIGFFVMPVIPILATHFGYVMGFREKRIFPSKKRTQNTKK